MPSGDGKLNSKMTYTPRGTAYLFTLGGFYLCQPEIDFALETFPFIRSKKEQKAL